MNGFLFDENLPRVTSLPTSFPVIHAVDLGERLTDTELWNYAKENGLVIVSKDADFSQRIVLSSPPPRVVHLRVGNLRRRDFSNWLQLTWPRIETFIRVNKLVSAYMGRIEAVE